MDDNGDGHEADHEVDEEVEDDDLSHMDSGWDGDFSETGDYPIRRAYLADNGGVEDIRAIVEADPESIVTPDGRGWLPLHRILKECHQNGSFSEIVRCIVETRPELAQMPTESANQYLPIHLACANCCPRDGIEEEEYENYQEALSVGIDTVRIIVQAWREAAQIQANDERKRYPLEFVADEWFVRGDVVKCLVTAWPQAIAAAYENGTLLLHEAVRKPGPSSADSLELVQFLVVEHPESVRARDGKGKLALHCIDYGTSLGVVKELVHQWGESVNEQDAEGYLPMHRAVAINGSSNEGEECLQVLDFLFQRSPRSVRVRADDGSIPLSVAARHKLCLGGIQRLVQMWPDSVRSKDNCGRLPIHLVFKRERWYSDPSMAPIVQFLIEQYPESLYEKDCQGDLPLHRLVKSYTLSHDGHLKTQLVELLVNAAPKTLSIPSSDRAYPLHDAVRNGFPLEGVRRLVNARPDSCQFQDKDGWTALHIAVARRQPPPSIVRFLVRRFPQSVQFATRDGSTALILALARSAPPMNLVRFLVEQDHDTLLSPNLRGMLPVHTAAAYNDSPEALRYLIEQEPRALSRMDRTGSLALHTALRHGKSLDFVRPLVEGFPKSLEHDDDSESLPLHVAAADIDSLETLQYLIEQEPKSLRKKDRAGSLPLHAALRSDAPFDFVQLLVQKFLKSVGRADNSGSLPLHVLLASGFAKVDVVQHLIKHQPRGLACLQHRNRLGYAPMHVAAMRGVPLDVLFVVVRSDPKVVFEHREVSDADDEGSAGRGEPAAASRSPTSRNPDRRKSRRIV